ncbi:hypothetical protein FHR75_002137 [Kineococcus radiotolerans]|uniref:Uncharacterized protein n=2 Tax=Kineococcus radiotolerans TaxID=131568 RepID=A6W3Y1_KINRD|nr:hypothetical protein [Kineococcus radiotolerans]ABS01520.1 conserved hypothetical protein [Kineococcus radiotolerans SRS30216 = ATCC BAA-149]MBB2901349.1 hypothetical protein [Kineococcus radiotolerans]
MYGAWWRVLPGPWWVRLLISLLVAGGVVLLCFTVVFPAVADHLAINDGTVEGR